MPTTKLEQNKKRAGKTSSLLFVYPPSTSAMPLPLPIRKGIRDSEPKLKEHIEKINNVTGKEWTLEVDWEYVYPPLQLLCGTKVNAEHV